MTLKGTAQFYWQEFHLTSLGGSLALSLLHRGGALPRERRFLIGLELLCLSLWGRGGRFAPRRLDEGEHPCALELVLLPQSIQTACRGGEGVAVRKYAYSYAVLESLPGKIADCPKSVPGKQARRGSPERVTGTP
eukprot:CAMPEP_0117679788 /NCGR_PEP_ID=MMETSP0804-20121206/17997_1 /TAXON_ID=1074897 /ORGANISM="Tetraselmis astigmatica, Strain CCMP880" /LENGTH=134 /DNA_ID=CAMNT_0005489225 /DNA_START=110 /DNA_END=510 /DNA_ORIENTATION=+